MFQRIDRKDGTRRPIEERQLLALLAAQLPSAEDAIRLAGRGRVVETHAAWFMRAEAPWLKPAPEAAEESGAERDSYTVVYGGRFYEITADGMEALGEMGAEVCGRDISSEQATYTILTAEGLHVPEPDVLEPDALSALVSLHAEATYLEQRFWSGDYVPRREQQSDEMRILFPRIHESLGRAAVVIGKLRDEAVKTPKLLDQRAEREQTTFERIRVDIIGWLLRNEIPPEDVNFYTRSDWALRGEQYGRDSVLAATFEGSPLYHVLNDTSNDRATSARLYEELCALLAAHGYYYELGYSWSLSLYPL